MITFHSNRPPAQQGIRPDSSSIKRIIKKSAKKSTKSLLAQKCISYKMLYTLMPLPLKRNKKRKRKKNPIILYLRLHRLPALQMAPTTVYTNATMAHQWLGFELSKIADRKKRCPFLFASLFQSSVRHRNTVYCVCVRKYGDPFSQQPLYMLAVIQHSLPFWKTIQYVVGARQKINVLPYIFSYHFYYPSMVKRFRFVHSGKFRAHLANNSSPEEYIF